VLPRLRLRLIHVFVHVCTHVCYTVTFTFVTRYGYYRLHVATLHCWLVTRLVRYGCLRLLFTHISTFTTPVTRFVGYHVYTRLFTYVYGWLHGLRYVCLHTRLRLPHVCYAHVCGYGYTHVYGYYPFWLRWILRSRCHTFYVALVTCVYVTLLHTFVHVGYVFTHGYAFYVRSRLRFNVRFAFRFTTHTRLPHTPHGTFTHTLPHGWLRYPLPVTRLVAYVGCSHRLFTFGYAHTLRFTHFTHTHVTYVDFTPRYRTVTVTRLHGYVWLHTLVTLTFGCYTFVAVSFAFILHVYTFGYGWVVRFPGYLRLVGYVYVWLIYGLRYTLCGLPCLVTVWLRLFYARLITTARYVPVTFGISV